MARSHTQPTLRLSALAFAVGSLAACGGGEVIESDAAEPPGALSADAAGRATTLASSNLPAGSIQLLTTTTRGSAATISSTTCGLSADGRLVLFSSDAANFVAGDTNGRTDLFLKNLATGAVQRVTTQSNGAQLAAGGSCQGMTPDGRFVSFNSGGAVFVKNTQTGLLTQASPPAGTVPQVMGYFGGALSHDGRHVVFTTQPAQVYVGGYDYANVVPARVMLRNLETGSLQTLATDNGIVAQGQVISLGAAISPDGTRVAFVSSSGSLVPHDNNARPDVFVRDLVSGGTTLVSSTTEGLASTAVQYFGAGFVSDSQVSFRTSATSSLGAGGLYLKDLSSGVLSLVMSTAEGDANGLSADARKVLFTRLYSGFDRRVFVRDRATGQDALVSASATGTASNGNATGAIISNDGSTVIFGSNARNLVAPRPPAGVFQVYAKSIGEAGAQ
jgi:Tol biopolymer transport system component